MNRDDLKAVVTEALGDADRRRGSELSTLATEFRQGLGKLNQKMSLHGAELDRQGRVQAEHGQTIERLRARIFETNGQKALTVQTQDNARRIDEVAAKLEETQTPAQGGKWAAIITALLTGLAALAAALKGASP